ncbi:sensor histidine kinase [Actinokineospora sp. UTMC 2448]|uniref:sensor histidine kinase n=1 Tax=Actinokineospora sp. UTMC 2448 TaxID=2268449 RepID=UPI002164D649|nr:histidine kinase [Actinokineospora sp. UTMC 2448]
MERRRRPWQLPVWHAVIWFGFGSVLLAVDVPLVLDAAVLPAPHWARLLVLAALCALHLARDTHPVPALIAGQPLLLLDAAMGLSLPALLAAGDLLYSAVLNGPRRASRVLLGAAFACVAAAAAVSLTIGKDLRDSTLYFLTFAPIPMLPVWWATNVRRQREAAEAERARADQLAHIVELDRAAAVQRERAAMARDLHDVIAGHVSAVAIQSEALLSRADGDATARAVLRSVRENSVAALTEMRAMIGLLRSESPDALTAPARLRDLAQLVGSARAAGLDVAASAEVGELPAAVDLSAYRIVQEALTNAVKHGGSRAEVNVRQADGRLVVEVVNDVPAARERGDGTGLLSMTERAAAVGGALSAGPRGGRWHVRADLPLEES